MASSVGFGLSSTSSSSSPYTSSSRNFPKTNFKVVSTITTNEGSSSAPRRKRRMSQEPTKQRKPSVYEVQKAIGIVDDEDNHPRRPDVEGGSPSMMDLMTLTSVGQKEGFIEKKFRETAEWVVQQTEDRALSGQKFVLMVCLRILPVWVLLLLVASGAIRLPFNNIPFLDAILS